MEWGRRGTRGATATASSGEPVDTVAAGAATARKETVMSSSPPLRGFTCAFTRRNCTHDALFSHQYMRCFPHCCPQHVSRSYCGASLYLQVDLDQYFSVVTRSDEARDYNGELDGDDNLQVFGRFRLQEACGLAVGELVPMDVIMSSLLSESNPTGEWVASRLIASAGHNAWLFEINPSAKWFYDWEVGAVRDRRTMPHVFEAYVLILCEERQADRTRTPNVQMTSAAVPPFSVSTTSADRGTLWSESGDSFEVVAFVASSPFTLISFRRARSSRFSQGAEMAHPSGEQHAIDTDEQFQRPLSALGNDRGNRPSDNRGLGADTSAHERDNISQEVIRDRSLSELFRVSDFGLDLRTHLRSEEDFNMEAEERNFNMEPQSRVASAVSNMMFIIRFLRQVPLRATLQFMSTIEQHLNATLCEHLGLNTLSAASLKFSTFVPRLLDSTHSIPPVQSTDSEMLIKLSINLMLWMLFDRDNNAQMEVFLQRSAKVLLDKEALYKSYEAWTEWLQERIDEYLFSQGWSLARLVAQVELYFAPIGASLSSISGGATVNPAVGSSSFFATDTHVAAGHTLFVVQVREIYVSVHSISPSPQLTQTRIHRRVWSASQSSRDSSSKSANRLSQFTGLWFCDLDMSACQDIASVSPEAIDGESHHQEPIGIMSLVWMWKQFGCIRMAFSTESGVPALVIGSVFNPSLCSAAAAEGRMTRIVLDHQHHWFRCFPGGESSIGVRIGGQSFGDYVASVGADESDDGTLVEIKCYSWPSTGSQQTSSHWPYLRLPSTSISAAFCWHWQLSTHKDDRSAFISANVKISTSQVHLNKVEGGSDQTSTPSVLPFDPATEPLSKKLGLIRHWEPAHELQLQYRRLGC